jgi:PPK2 family polyphosphate:nucleotide phosphotransferase
MKIQIDKFAVPPGKNVKLKEWPTRVKPFYDSKENVGKFLQDHVSKLRELQDLLYAQHRYAILLIFQAMDAAGKDSAIEHVMSGVNPQGCQVFSFKQPSSEELAHDFLWRTTCRLPERGHIGIFNRSYYEEVLIARVHPEVLHGQSLPGETLDDSHFWRHRYESIVDFEKHLHRNGTRVVKFFLHISKEEQRRRFLRRIDLAEKNWKFSEADVRERQWWKQYAKAYERCLEATSTEESPWYVIPSDDKPNGRLIIAEVITQTLEGLRLGSLQPDKRRRRELLKIRELLVKE